MRAATEAAVEHGASAPAALIALHTFLGGTSVDGLSRVLALTHSGSVRLVDRLQTAGLLERGRGPDARTRTVRLTAAGHTAAEELQRERETALADLLAPLDREERDTLGALLGRILAGITHDHADAGHICRMCDPDACGHPDRCPVTAAAARQAH